MSILSTVVSALTEVAVCSVIGKVNTKVGGAVLGIAKSVGLPEEVANHFLVKEIASIIPPAATYVAQLKYGKAGLVGTITDKWLYGSVTSAAVRVTTTALRKLVERDEDKR